MTKCETSTQIFREEELQTDPRNPGASRHVGSCLFHEIITSLEEEGLSKKTALLSFGGKMPRKTAYGYLIHFEEKYHHVGHYLGYSKHLWFRITCRRANTGAKLLKAVNQTGIDWAVVRTWAVNSQELERRLKSLKNSPRLCRICNPELADEVGI